ncbi:hypothetical protein FOCC_FOCC017739 [Frankliniella occidentalis]|nr:hypothetical protein FOCC_FOCC017739 [Frankliniella occidentalis]
MQLVQAVANIILELANLDAHLLAHQVVAHGDESQAEQQVHEGDDPPGLDATVVTALAVALAVAEGGAGNEVAEADLAEAGHAEVAAVQKLASTPKCSEPNGLFLVDSEARCNSPIVLRVGTVPGPKDTRRAQRRGRAPARSKKDSKKVTRMASPTSSSTEVDERTSVFQVDEGGADEVDATAVGKKRGVIVQETDAEKGKTTEVGVQTTPRLARRVNLSLSIAPPPTAELTPSATNTSEPSTPTNSPISSPTWHEYFTPQGVVDTDPLLHVEVKAGDSAQSDSLPAPMLQQSADEPASTGEVECTPLPDSPPRTVRATPEIKTEGAHAMHRPTEDECQIVFGSGGEAGGEPSSSKAVFARGKTPQLPSTPPPPTPPSTPFWLGANEELLQLQSVAIVQAAARQLRGESSPPPDTQTPSGPFQEAPVPPSPANEAALHSAHEATVLATPVQESPHLLSEHNELHLHPNAQGIPASHKIEASKQPGNAISLPRYNLAQGSPTVRSLPTRSTPRPQPRHWPLVPVLKKPDAPPAKTNKRVSFDENLVKELAPTEQEWPKDAAPRVDDPETTEQEEQPLVRITCWAARNQDSGCPQNNPRKESDAAKKKTEAIEHPQSQPPAQRLRKPWVRSSRPGLQLAVPDIIPINTIASVVPRTRTRKLSDGYRTPFRSVPLCLPSPALDM